MTNFSVRSLSIEGLKLLVPFYVEDERGYFLKDYEADTFTSLGVPMQITEDFESRSIRDTVRGLHFQTTNPQAKLVRAIQGEIFDVAVDLRMNSSTFRQWHAEILTDQNHFMFYIPAGFAHGFMVLSETALVQYKCEGVYNSATDGGIIWNDESIGIEWPSFENLTLSDKDANLQTLAYFVKRYGGLHV